ncbi:MAG: methylcobalamin:coenzyme M methyltransferase [Lentisphaerae bacterium ADurb.BinA184]|nr:MAG: methylcobalamin:coenzyme M methyltransferase [Lentisphaerae bacterium ADurb.BinA184]
MQPVHTAPAPADATETPRARVRAALAHRQPARVPFSWQFCATPEMQQTLEAELAARGRSWNALQAATEDIGWIGPAYCGPAQFAGGPWHVFGIGWKDVNYGAGTYREVETYPLAGVDSLQALDDYPWPSPDWYDYDGLGRQLAAADPNKALKFGAFNPFETLCWMTGLEEVLCNCCARPELVVRGLEHIVEFYEQRTIRCLERIGHGVEIVFFFDDLGSQNGPLMSPAMYGELLKPFHRRLFARAHQLAPNAKVMMHSDGSVFALLDDLSDAGLDVLEAVQVDCADMEPRHLKDAFGDRLSFHGAISVQQLLPKADAATVERTCRELVDVLGAGGGYIAAPSHAIQMGTPVANVLAMLRGVLGREDYAAAWEAASAAPKPAGASADGPEPAEAGTTHRPTP